MNPLRVLSRLVPRLPRAAALVTAALVPASPSMAGITLSSSSAVSYFALDTSTPSNAGSLPIFVNQLGNGDMLTAGSGLAQIATVSTAVAASSTGTMLPAPPTGFSVNSNSLTGLPSEYGTATTSIYAAATGQQGASTPQGGIFFNAGTSLADNLSPGDTTHASVASSTGIATFTNNSSSLVILNPGTVGAALSVVGTVNTNTGGSVEAGLSTFITLSGTDYSKPLTYQLDSIALGAGQLSVNDGVVGGPTISPLASTISPLALTGLIPGGFNLSNPYFLDGQEAASASYSNGQLTGTGSVFDPYAIDLGTGDAITITSYLTLISDPGSSIALSDSLDPNFTGQIPGFGAFAGAVPEPSSLVMLGAGMAGVAAWSRRQRRRTSAGI